ncbi:MAG: hypothetical protein H7A18_01150 [Sinobacteraceae bacterium]|nr:hypothetical protein [Nevskiaceae bacterium]MCP5470674.1 hypothetical protein [Nevskiaceae bacterium]
MPGKPPPATAAAVTPYDRAALLEPAQLEAWFAADQQRPLLHSLFGPATCAELRRLARAAQASRRRRPPSNRPRAWVLPGILGTRLGRRRGQVPDVLWFDPDDLVAGRATLLRQQPRDRLYAMGVIDQSYLKLWLRLVAAGFEPEYFGYDWRRSVAANGAAFASRLRADARPATIVAHSLGGLVARAALRRTRLPPIERIVLLGTPNLGSYAAVQAMRGSYAAVRRIAMLDRRHDALTLSRDVFTSFDSLYDLLPRGALAIPRDYHDPASWPTQAPRPDPARLAAARGLAARLVDGDARFVCIAGIGTPTVVGASLRPREFSYRYRRDGDGTVPLDSARLDGTALYVAPITHGLLPRDDRVIDAVIDLLRNGRTDHLQQGRPRARSAGFTLRDRDLYTTLADKLDWSALEPPARLEFIEKLSDPGPLERMAGVARSGRRPQDSGR